MKKVTGKISWFGGKLDATMSPKETLALYPNILYPQSGNPDSIAKLNPKQTLALYPSITRDMMQYPFINPMYCAMRWNYKQIANALKMKQRFAIKQLRKANITIEFKERMINVVPVDWGPDPKTNRIIDVSPLAMKTLNCQTDDEVTILLPDWIFLT
jgi:hypothetical protein